MAGDGRGKSLARNEDGAGYSTACMYAQSHSHVTIHINKSTNLSELERSQAQLERNWARPGSEMG